MAVNSPVKKPAAGNWLSCFLPRELAGTSTFFARTIEEGLLTATDVSTIGDLIDLSQLTGEKALPSLLAAMFAALHEGNPCMELTVASLAARMADLGVEDAAESAVEVVASMEAGRYAALIAESDAGQKPLVRYRAGAATYLYFQKHLKHEIHVWSLLRERVKASFEPGDLGAIRKALEAASKAQNASQPLTDEQRLALGLSLLRPLMVISGGPGTGKTSVVGALLLGLAKLGIGTDRIALAAPTGRAAQRLTDSIRQRSGSPAALERLPQAVTLHQLLQYSPSRGVFRRHEENPLTCEVAIVDEASMVGLTLLAQLLRALPPTARLILLGDKDQLPSVEAGGWLSHLAPGESGPNYSTTLRKQLAAILPKVVLPPATKTGVPDVLALLTKNHRSETRIQELAATVNRQDPTALDPLRTFNLDGDFADVERDGGCWLFDPNRDAAVWRRILRRWGEHFYLAGRHGISFRDRARQCSLPLGPDVPSELHATLAELFAVIDRVRILSLVHEGPWGTETINESLAALLRPAGERGSHFAGAPVMITRNDHERRLFNGDVGLMLPTKNNGLRVVFPKEGGYAAFDPDSLPAFQLAFGLTVHKSQGSEYGHVMLVVPPDGAGRLLSTQILYTGLTRAKQSVIICGSEDTLARAIGRRSPRVSGVAEMMLEGI